MKISKLLWILFITTGLSAQAQEFDFSVTDHWADKPVKHSLHKMFDSASAICLLDAREIDYRTDIKSPFVAYSFHRIFYVRDDKGIEMLNKLYIPLNTGSELAQVKIRVVLKDGKVINIDSSRIKRIEEEGKLYAISALDGLERGAEIEYKYVINYPLFLFSAETYQATNFPVQDARFLLVAPENLRFSAKGYNGVKVSNDSVINGKRIITGYSTDIPAMPDEKYAYREKHMQYVEYKLSYNLTTSGNVRMYTWKELAKKMFARYTERTEKETQVLTAFVAKMNIPATAGNEEKIELAEDYIKSSINIDKKLIGKDVDMLDNVVKNLSANMEGICKLFCGVYEKLDVNMQVVFPGNRSSTLIDEEVENWNKLDDVLLYFPATGKYLSPMNTELRYPYVPYLLTGVRGLFLKGTTIGNFKTAIGVFNEIKIEPLSEHSHNMEVEINFNPTVDTVLLKSKQLFRGYAASNIRPVYSFYAQDKQDEITKRIIEGVVNTKDISNIRVENTKLVDGGHVNKPLVIYGESKSSDLIEIAGKKILFKIGEVIGLQEQMYQEKPRVLPVEIDYPHVLNRKLVMHIPDGYTAENLKDLVFDISYKENDEVVAGFVSGFVQKGNDIEVNLYETYRKIEYPLSFFPAFQKVINASADFNKVVLVLRKN